MVLRVTSNEDKHKESDDVMVSLKRSLAESLGREPTKADLKCAKAALRSKLERNGGEAAAAATEPSPTVWRVQKIAQRMTDAGEVELIAPDGFFTQRDMIVFIKGSEVTTTLDDVRAKAKRSFAINEESGVRVFIGTSLDQPASIAFVADEKQWREELALLILRGNGTLPERTAFVLEVLPSHESGLSCTTRSPPPGFESAHKRTPASAATMNLTMKSTPIELEHAIKAVMSAGASNPRGRSRNQGRAAAGVKGSKKAKSDDDDDDDDEDDDEDGTIGDALNELEHTRAVLAGLVKQMAKPPYVTPGGEAMYVLTDGTTAASKAYIPYDGALPLPAHSQTLSCSCCRSRSRSRSLPLLLSRPSLFSHAARSQGSAGLRPGRQGRTEGKHALCGLQCDPVPCARSAPGSSTEVRDHTPGGRACVQPCRPTCVRVARPTGRQALTAPHGERCMPLPIRWEGHSAHAVDRPLRESGGSGAAGGVTLTSPHRSPLTAHRSPLTLTLALALALALTLTLALLRSRLRRQPCR